MTEIAQYAVASCVSRDPEKAEPRVAVVIPVYNHAGTLKDVTDRAKLLGLPVVVMDDGSSDDTPEVTASLEGVTVLRHEVNQGKGAAILTACHHLRDIADVVITIDADGQHDPSNAGRLIAAAKEYPGAFIVGRRENMLNDRRIPWTSRFGRGFSNFWVRACGGPRLSDTQCGFRLYPIATLNHWIIRAKRYQFEVEVLVKAGWAGISVIEVPVDVTYTPAGGRISHFRPFLDFLRNSATFSSLFLTRCFLPVPVRRQWLD